MVSSILVEKFIMFLFQIKVSHALVRFEKVNILGFYDIDSR